MTSDDTLLEVSLSVDYPTKPGVLSGVAFQMRRGEVVGMLGESGSGKSTIALSLLKLLKWKRGRTTGQIVFCGRDLMSASEREMQSIRGHHIGLVLQSPLASLNPALRIGTQLGEAWGAHANGNARDRRNAVARALARVGLPHDEEFQRRYSSQISVGQAQRVLIAMAVMHSPLLLIADEPTSALDAMTQVEVLEMLATLNREMGTALLYISHDLQSIASICQRIIVLHDGTIVESGATESVLETPQHPYTQRLLACVPFVQARREASRISWPFVPHGVGEFAHVLSAGTDQGQAAWGLKSPSTCR